MRCEYKLTGRVDGELREMRCSRKGCGHSRWSKHPPKRVANECSGRESRGLGDTVANAIQAVTFGLVKPCGGCKKRQEALNKMFPYAHPKDQADDWRSA